MQTVVHIHESSAKLPLTLAFEPQTPEKDIECIVREAIENIVTFKGLNSDRIVLIDLATGDRLPGDDQSRLHLYKHILVAAEGEDDQVSSMVKSTHWYSNGNIVVKGPRAPRSMHTVSEGRSSSHSNASNFQNPPPQVIQSAPIAPVEVKENPKKEDPPANQVVREPHYLERTGGLYTTPLDGKNPHIWSGAKGCLPFSFLQVGSHFRADCPPPCYLPYSRISKPRKMDKQTLLSGTEITEDGLLKCVDQTILDRQKGIVTDVLKKLASSLANGRGVVGISLPIRIFEARSLVERIADWWSFAPTYLNRAATISDPLERMKLVIAFAIGGIYVNASQFKPFNPILGETYEGEYMDGTKIYCEHMSHHPPITTFLVMGKGYKFSGHYVYNGSLNTTSLLIMSDGPNVVTFDDGQRIVFNMPYIRSKGMLFGDRTYAWVGYMRFEDTQNRLRAAVKLDADIKKGMFGSKRADIFRGKIYECDPSKKLKDVRGSDAVDLDVLKTDDLVKELSPLEGSVLKNLIIDGKEYWNIDRDNPTPHFPIENPLPSDWRYREDLIWLSYGDQRIAEAWKLRLEELQRGERTLRLEHPSAKAHAKNKH